MTYRRLEMLQIIKCQMNELDYWMGYDNLQRDAEDQDEEDPRTSDHRMARQMNHIMNFQEHKDAKSKEKLT